MKQAAQHFESRQSMNRSDFEIFHYKDRKPGCVELHHHDFYEVYCFLSGDVEYPWIFRKDVKHLWKREKLNSKENRKAQFEGK